MTEDAGPMISVRALSAHAGPAMILDDIDIDIHAGEIITLFGPSGAGKTTIAAALADVDRPGITLSGEIHRGSATIGYLPQDAAATLNPARRIGAALGELVDLHHRRTQRGRTGRQARRAQVARVLRSVAFDVDAHEFDRKMRRFPFEFSGGERTRLALAQVLAREPDVLVVDEPTVGLDSLARETLLTQLTELRSAGTAIVLVTHDPFAVEQVSDRTLFVREGRLVDAAESTPVSTSTAPSPPPTAATPALELREVSVALRHSQILRDIQFELQPGRTLGLIGLSGAGKSTIARCVAGLLAPDTGAVLIDGTTVPMLRKRSRTQIAAVQYVWQESASSFDPRRRVLDQVAATAVRLRGLDRAAAHAAALEMLLDLGVDIDQATRYPPGLSGGQLQRAAIARALLARPQVLVCDEITTALDRPLAHRILDYIDEYRRTSGAAVLSISHDLRSQLHRADRLAIIDDGRIVETGIPTGLLAHPKSTLLRRLIEAENLTALDLQP